MGRRPIAIGGAGFLPTLLLALALLLGHPPLARGLTPKVTTACRSLVRALETPPRVGGSTPAWVLARFAALRTPQQPSDLPPAGLRRAITGVFTRYQPASVRRLGTVPGGTIYLVSGTASRPPVSASCRRALSARQLRGVGALGGGLPSGPGYCLLEYAPASFARDLCSPYAAVLSGYALGTDSQGRASDYAGLVPDGVGSVTLNYVSPQTPITLAVTDNLASGTAPAGFTSIPKADLASPTRLRRRIERTLPVTVAWLSSPDGPVVQTFHRPRGIVGQGVAKIQALDSIL